MREEREEAARDARIRARYTHFAEGWYVEAVESRCCDPDTLPTRHDAVWVWEDMILQDDARAPLDLDDHALMNELAGADEFLEGYPQSVINSLIWDYMAVERRRSAAADCDDGSQGGGMKKGKGKGKGKQARHKSADPEDILRHPTALFRCGDCGDYPYAWPRINGHWRERHPDESVWTARGGEDEQAFNAEVWEDGMEVAERILEVLIEQCLRNRDRDRPHLDGLIREGRVFCKCGDPRMETPEQGLNWAGLVSRSTRSYRTGTFMFTLVVECR